MREHIRKITDFLIAHGAERVTNKNTKGGHIQIDYVWKGRPKFVVVPHTPSDMRGFKNTIALLRRELGKPISPVKRARSLDELVADLVPKTPEEPVMRSVQVHTQPFNPLPAISVQPGVTLKTETAAVTGQCYIGMGHYDVHHPDDERKVLRVSITEEVWVAAGSPEYVVFSRVDDGTWRISPAQKAKLSATMRKGRPGFITTGISSPPEIYKGLGVWGSTLGKAIVDGTTILISVDLANLKPMRPRNIQKIQKRIEAPKPQSYSKEEIRKALDVITHVAKTMPVKLIKLPNGSYDFRLDLGC